MDSEKKRYTLLANRVLAVKFRSGFETGIDFANALGIAKSTYYQYEKGERKSIRDPNVIEKMAELSGFSAEWIKTGEGYPIEDDPGSFSLLDNLAPDDAFIELGKLDIKLLETTLKSLLIQAKDQNLSPAEIAKFTVSTYNMVKEMKPADPEQVIKGAISIGLQMRNQ